VGCTNVDEALVAKLGTMNIHVFVADFSSIESRLPNLQGFLTICVGIAAGLTVVGAIHYLIRPRMTVAPPSRPSTPETTDPFVHGSAFEQRKAVRREGNPTQVMVVDSSTGQAPTNVFVVDRCVGGLGLYAPDPIEPGRQLKVRPTNAPAVTPWVEVIVKSCRPTSQGFEIGCQFVKTPPWAILLMFG
jgi:hypothetical protein